MSKYSEIENFTIRKAVEAFLHYVADSQGYVVDDTAYSKKAVKDHLLNSRMTVTKQKLNDTGFHPSEMMVQTLPCVELVEADRNECPCQPASGFYWLRTVEPIPEMIRTTSVTTTLAKGHEDDETFQFVKWDRFKNLMTSRIKSLRRKRYYTIRDTSAGPYLYIYNDRFLENAAISAIFAEPAHAAAFPKCGEVNLDALCNPLDVDFYTDRDLIDMILKDAAPTAAQLRGIAPRDVVEDDRHGPPITQK